MIASKKKLNPRITVGRAELAAELSPLLKLSKASARIAVDAMLDTIAQHIIDGDRVELRGFVTMQKRRVPARRRRNPAAANLLDQSRREREGRAAAEPFINVPAHDVVAVKVSPKFLRGATAKRGGGKAEKIAKGDSK